MKPSDGEVECLRAVELRLGAGTKAKITHIAATQRGTEAEIVATLELRATVTLGNSATIPFARCGACGAVAPPPDNDGLWYIIQNHDGDRIVFPVPEKEAEQEPERDQYPVPGWHRLEEMIVCGTCHAAMLRALKARKKRGAP